MEQIRTLNEAHLELLAAMDINTVRDFAVADADAILELRGARGSRSGRPDVCSHKRRAQALVNKCTVKTEYYPGYEYRADKAVFANPADESVDNDGIDTATNPQAIVAYITGVWP